MTVGELINRLMEHPLDAPVCAEWEGHFEPFGEICTAPNGWVVVCAEAGSDWYMDKVRAGTLAPRLINERWIGATGDGDAPE